MGADCCGHRALPDPHRGNPAYRRALWAVLAINAGMRRVVCARPARVSGMRTIA
jgi:hypothetical protein